MPDVMRWLFYCKLSEFTVQDFAAARPHAPQVRSFVYCAAMRAQPALECAQTNTLLVALLPYACAWSAHFRIQESITLSSLQPFAMHMHVTA